jgi:hypothetical protein
MWRKILTAAFIVFWSASIALAQSQTLPIRVANTNWTGHETLGGYGSLRFAFSGSGVTMYDKDGATSGTWEQNGQSITMRFYQGTVVYSGTMGGQVCNYRTSFFKNSDDFYVFSVGVACRGATMSGTARNSKGRTWNWSMATAPIDVAVSGTYDGAPFGFMIPLGSDGRGGGEATLGRENPDPALLTWQLQLAQR